MCPFMSVSDIEEPVRSSSSSKPLDSLGVLDRLPPTLPHPLLLLLLPQRVLDGEDDGEELNPLSEYEKGLGGLEGYSHSTPCVQSI